MYTRFDLEQALMAAWTTEDDVALLAEHTLEYADGSDGDTGMNVDDVVNALFGLQRLHHMRMQKVWQIFETLVAEKAFGDFTDDADAELNDDEEASRAPAGKWPRDSER